MSRIRKKLDLLKEAQALPSRINNAMQTRIKEVSDELNKRPHTDATRPIGTKLNGRRWAGQSYGWQSEQSYQKLQAGGEFRRGEQTLRRLGNDVSNVAGQAWRDLPKGAREAVKGGAKAVKEVVWDNQPKPVKEAVKGGLRLAGDVNEAVSKHTNISRQITGEVLATAATAGVSKAIKGSRIASRLASRADDLTITRQASGRGVPNRIQRRLDANDALRRQKNSGAIDVWTADGQEPRPKRIPEPQKTPHQQSIEEAKKAADKELSRQKRTRFQQRIDELGRDEYALRLKHNKANIEARRAGEPEPYPRRPVLERNLSNRPLRRPTQKARVSQPPITDGSRTNVPDARYESGTRPVIHSRVAAARSRRAARIASDSSSRYGEYYSGGTWGPAAAPRRPFISNANKAKRPTKVQLRKAEDYLKENDDLIIWENPRNQIGRRNETTLIHRDDGLPGYISDSIEGDADRISNNYTDRYGGIKRYPESSRTSSNPQAARYIQRQGPDSKNVAETKQRLRDIIEENSRNKDQTRHNLRNEIDVAASRRIEDAIEEAEGITLPRSDNWLEDNAKYWMRRHDIIEDLKPKYAELIRSIKAEANKAKAKIPFDYGANPNGPHIGERLGRIKEATKKRRARTGIDKQQDEAFKKFINADELRLEADAITEKRRQDIQSIVGPGNKPREVRVNLDRREEVNRIQRSVNRNKSGSKILDELPGSSLRNDGSIRENLIPGLELNHNVENRVGWFEFYRKTGIELHTKKIGEMEWHRLISNPNSDEALDTYRRIVAEQQVLDWVERNKLNFGKPKGDIRADKSYLDELFTLREQNLASNSSIEAVRSRIKSNIELRSLKNWLSKNKTEFNQMVEARISGPEAPIKRQGLLRVDGNLRGLTSEVKEKNAGRIRDSVKRVKKGSPLSEAEKEDLSKLLKLEDSPITKRYANGKRVKGDTKRVAAEFESGLSNSARYDADGKARRVRSRINRTGRKAEYERLDVDGEDFRYNPTEQDLADRRFRRELEAREKTERYRKEIGEEFGYDISRKDLEQRYLEEFGRSTQENRVNGDRLRTEGQAGRESVRHQFREARDRRGVMDANDRIRRRLNGERNIPGNLTGDTRVRGTYGDVKDPIAGNRDAIGRYTDNPTPVDKLIQSKLKQIVRKEKGEMVQGTRIKRRLNQPDRNTVAPVQGPRRAVKPTSYPEGRRVPKGLTFLDGDGDGVIHPDLYKEISPELRVFQEQAKLLRNKRLSPDKRNRIKQRMEAVKARLRLRHQQFTGNSNAGWGRPR